ncbi:Copia-like retroelement pol polyprotein [Abeliophyllum distichum]|uniref:Copia-like retroelement pol polyprotein n=1 Tax=Abeliophyllum distichum TaxID=126358 RepID=A0ABD1QJ15_9LAMI
MIAILVQQRVSRALDDPENYLDDLKEKSTEIVDMNEIAYSFIILHLFDNIVGQVDDSKTARVLWFALDALFLTKTLPNKIYLLKKLFSFKMDTSKDLEANLSDFSIMAKNVKNAIKYARDILTQAIVINAQKSRDLEVKKEFRSEAREKIHFVRGVSEKMEGSNYSNKGKKHQNNVVLETEMDCLHVMTVSKDNQNQEWILDSGCTFHMSPVKAWFNDYKDIEPRNVYMGNNNTQVVVGVGDIAIKMHDGMIRIIHNVRKVWISLLKTKDEAFKNFRNWVTLVVFQKETEVKTLRTDNGLEFCNLEFDIYCKERGIQRHRTVRYIPQQNGVAEKLSRNIMDKVRCMLISSVLSKVFWDEVACIVVYLINRSPSSAINFKTPRELWSRKPPNLSHLRVFGSGHRKKSPATFCRSPPLSPPCSEKEKIIYHQLAPSVENAQEAMARTRRTRNVTTPPAPVGDVGTESNAATSHPQQKFASATQLAALQAQVTALTTLLQDRNAAVSHLPQGPNPLPVGSSLLGALPQDPSLSTDRAIAARGSSPYS